jgi:L-alanine-DL-glutamate epimerase-like enolase superfamily enzyme
MSEHNETISWIKLHSVYLPLKTPISDAKVLTGRQKPMTEIAILFCEIGTSEGHAGLGISYSKRAGGPGQFAHAREIAPALMGEDPNDISKAWDKLCWAGASVGRTGLAVQAIGAFDVALWDMKAKRAGLSLAKLLGAQRDSVRCYNTSGGFLHTPLDELLVNTDISREKGIGGIKLKVGQPNWALDIERVAKVRAHLGDTFPLMVDANQQWDRPTAMRMGRIFEQFNLIWIEEPLDCYDAAGHAALAVQLDTPIATGEMLTSVLEHWDFIRQNGADFLMPDAPRVGGVTPFMKVAALAEFSGLQIAPHFSMELHIHLAAAMQREPWVEHFEWLEPLFNERLDVKDGRMIVPTRPGIGISMSEQAAAWTRETAEFGSPG